MIDYRACEIGDFVEVVESLAYKLLQYQHPGWYEIPEEEVVSLLRQEGLPINPRE